MRRLITLGLAFSLLATSAMVTEAATAAVIPPPLATAQTIGGSIFTGNSSVRYLYDLADPAGEPIAVYDNCLKSQGAGTVLSPITGLPLTTVTGAPDPGPPGGAATCPALAGAKVMVQNQHSGGEFIAYGTVTGNSWSATIDRVLYPDVIVTFSAPGHDVTSREFTWSDAAGSYTHPIPGAPAVGGATGVQAGGNIQDAYLPPLDNVDVSGAGTLPTGNLLHYVFYDRFVNGADDGQAIDPGLNCVTVNAYDETGTLLQSLLTGDINLDGVVDTNDTFTTTDGLTYGGVGGMPVDGNVYFTGLPSGEIRIESDPSTVTQGCNPQFNLSIADDLQRAAAGWSLTYTEEGGSLWEVPLSPKDPGTEAGAYMTWHGFIENIGQVGDITNPTFSNPALSGSVSVTLLDADGNDPLEPFPFMVPGRIDGGYLNGSDVEPNARITNGAVALYTVGDFPTLVATGRASQPTGQNVQNGAEITFTNLPPGKYEMFAWDVPLHNVPLIGTAVNVVPGMTIQKSLLIPRFGARAQGYVMNGTTPVAGATVKVHYKSGITKDEAVTDANGWFNFEFLPEVEVMGHVFVELPDGSTYRGRVITEPFNPGGANPTIPVTHNAQNRYVQWATFNYWVDIQVENIPTTGGDIHGVVFNDNLATGSWVGDGLYDDRAERTLHGVAVELYDATGTTLLATTTTGAFSKTDTIAQGWQEPYTWPPNEVGGVFAGPATFDGSTPAAPRVGMYEFRDMPPGDYMVKVVSPPGYLYSPSPTSVLGGEATTVVGGQSARVDLGASTTQAPDQSLYLALDCGPLGNASACAEDLDIIRLNSDGTTTVVFDGSNVTQAIGTRWPGQDPINARIDGFAFLSESEILISIQRPMNRRVFGLPAGPAVDDSDVLLFTADSLGAGTTSGTWSRYFDGSVVGLTTWGEGIDAVGVLPGGSLLLSTRGVATIGTSTYQDEDVFRFDFTTGPGTTTAGTDSLYFDGTNTRLTRFGEDIDGFALDDINTDVHVSTAGSFSVGPWRNRVKGQNDDVIGCTVASLGTPTSCSSWALTFDGASLGFDPYNVIGLDLDRSVIGPPVFGVPRAGETEGGVFDDVGPLDPRTSSLLWDEKAGIVGAPVGVYDHNGYFLGVMFMGDPVCYAGSTTCGSPFPVLGQKPEAERRFAPGVHRYLGNDPGFSEDANNNGILDAGEDLNANGNLDRFNPSYISMELPYTFPQAGYKFEADWSLLPAPSQALTADICVTNIAVSNTGPGDPWGAIVDVSVTEDSGVLGGLPVFAPVTVSGTWSTGEGGTATTNGAGVATITLTQVQPITTADLTFTVTGVTGPAWYVYNPANATIGACLDPATSPVVPNPNPLPALAAGGPAAAPAAPAGPPAGGGVIAPLAAGGATLSANASAVALKEGKWFATLSVGGAPGTTITYSFAGGEQITKSLPAAGPLVVKSETVEDPAITSVGFSVGDGTTNLTGTILRP